MAADINTQLQNITTDVTAIGNLVNRLVTIFSGGGVQNPDIAVAKAELQSWTTTQLSNVAKVDVVNTFTKPNNFKANISFNYDIASQNVYSGFHTLMSLKAADNTGLFALGAYQDSTTHDVGCVWQVFDKNNVRGDLRFAFSDKPSGGREVLLRIPSIDWTDYANIGYRVVNLGSLGNFNNPIVVNRHGGSQEILGQKTFVNSKVYTACRDNVHNGGFGHKYENLSRGQSATSYYDCMFTSFDSNNKPVSEMLHKVTSDGTNTTNNQFRLRIYDLATISDSDFTGFTLSILNGYKYISCEAKFTPSVSNSYSLGDSSYLWSEVYAATGSIQTSDERYKEEITNIPESVLRAWGKVGFKQFKFKDAVEEKGSSARLHTGVIAQNIIQAFQSEGLDATRYGLLCYDAWEDQYEYDRIIDIPRKTEWRKVIDTPETENTDEVSHYEEVVIQEEVAHDVKTLKLSAGSRYSVRYDECLALECAYQRWELNKIKAKLGM